MNIENCIDNFDDWSFSQGRPEFADDFGIEEHTRFCLAFIKRQLSSDGYYGLTGSLAIFFDHIDEISDLDAYRNINLLMGYYIYMNSIRNKDWETHMEIKLDAEKIRNIMVLV